MMSLTRGEFDAVSRALMEAWSEAVRRQRGTAGWPHARRAEPEPTGRTTSASTAAH